MSELEQLQQAVKAAEENLATQEEALEKNPTLPGQFQAVESAKEKLAQVQEDLAQYLEENPPEEAKNDAEEEAAQEPPKIPVVLVHPDQATLIAKAASQGKGGGSPPTITLDEACASLQEMLED